MKGDLDLFRESLAESQNVLIFLPHRPNFDEVAAGLSLYLSLTSYGKRVNIVCPSPMIVEFNRLVGVDKVSEDLGNKNMSIRFVNYNFENIERVKSEIDRGEFTLLIVPKPNAAAPKVEQVKLSYIGISADLLVLIGFEKPEDFGRFAENGEIFKQKSFLLGNKPALGLQSQEVISTDASCVSEAVARVVENLNLPVDQDIAGNLYLGIQAGTNRFSSQNISAETFETLASLMRAGANLKPKEAYGRFGQGQIASSDQKNDQQPVSQAGEPDLRSGIKAKPEKPPKDWFVPKIYKGTSIS